MASDLVHKYTLVYNLGIVEWISANTFNSFNVVMVFQAQLVLVCVTVCSRMYRLAMWVQANWVNLPSSLCETVK